MLQIAEPSNTSDMPLPLTIDRVVRVRSMSRTHKQLLLGTDTTYSGPDVDDSVVEVKFKAVAAFAIDFDVPNLTIALPDPSELRSVEAETGIDLGDRDDLQLFILRYGESSGYVVAGAAYFAEFWKTDGPQPMSLLYDVTQQFAPPLVYRLAGSVEEVG